MAISGFWPRIKQLFRSAPPRPPKIPTQYVTRVNRHVPPKPPKIPTQYVTPRRMPVPSQQPVVPPPVVPPAGPLDMATVVGTIHEAAKRHVLLLMTYNGISRLVEGYSFREKSTGRLFYGFCYKDGRINSFKLEKIEAIELTNQVFMPRWPVEL
jgi:hypothetical protein